MEFDASTAGVMPGGLNNRFQIKLLVCYVANELDRPISTQRFTSLMHYEGLANYFEMMSAVSSLEGSGHISYIEDKDDRKYVITQKGRDMLKEFVNMLPATIKKYSVDAMNKMYARERNERENKVSIEKKENGCIVSCSVMEGEREQMTIRLFVPDEDCAKNVIDIFLDDPTRIFVNVLDLMTGNQ